MRIVAATTNFPSTRDHHRGVFLENDLLGLAHRGHDVTCIVARSALRDRSKYAGATELHVYESKYLSLSYVRGFERLFGSFAQRNSTRNLRRLLSRHARSADVVYAKFLNTAPLLPAADPRMGRVLGIGEGMDSVHNRLAFFQPGEFAECLAGTDILEVKNSQVADWLAEEYPAHASKVRIVPSGVDTVFFAPGGSADARARLELPHDGFVAACIGARTVNKGGDRFLQACSLLEPAVIPVLAGAGWSSPIAGAVPLGVVDREQVSRVLRAADVFVLPSLSEGMPNAVLEAMACEVPCVVADRPYTSFLEHGVDCVKVDPADPAAIAQAIASLRADPALRASIARAGRATALKLNLDHRLDLMESCFRDALSGKAESSWM